MTKKEFSRLETVMAIEDRQMTVDQAAWLVGLSRRQIFRLLGGFRSIGSDSLASKRPGAPSNNRQHPAVRQWMIEDGLWIAAVIDCRRCINRGGAVSVSAN